MLKGSRDKANGRGVEERETERRNWAGLGKAGAGGASTGVEVAGGVKLEGLEQEQHITLSIDLKGCRVLPRYTGKGRGNEWKKVLRKIVEMGINVANKSAELSVLATSFYHSRKDEKVVRVRVKERISVSSLKDVVVGIVRMIEQYFDTVGTVIEA